MTVAAVAPVAGTWSARNQRWLSQRIAYWRDRVEQRNAMSAMPSDGDSFEPAAWRLRSLFGLSAFEAELLVVAAGIEIDAALHDAIARAQGTPSREPVRLAFSLALSILPEPHWDAVSPLGPLRYWSLADLDTTGGLAHATLRIDERVLHYLTGVGAFDPYLAGIVRVDDVSSFAGAVDERCLQIARELAIVREPLVMLHNGMTDAAHRRAARTLAAGACRHAGLRPLWVDTYALPPDARELEDVARRVDREAALVTGAVVLALDPDAPHTVAAVRFVASLRSPVVTIGALSAHQLVELPRREARRFDVAADAASIDAVTSHAVRRATERALTQFHVDTGVLDQALAGIDGDDERLEGRVWDALREASRGGLDTLAQRIDVDTTFEDLIVPPAVASQLREITAQLRHRRQVHDEWGFGRRHRRGLGIAALFTGESGTGKTLAAEAIADAARLDLYRIDLATVVNKYIGETEKNLARLFDAAERSGAVLLFDEADALFGKRSEVKDSHDRYANIEVAYLLQRIETYRGLAILTTNMKGALDRAFLRRIRFIVQFPFPDEAARDEIWRLHLPSRAPLGAIDYAALAKLPLSGGHIRSVAVNAAFRAAERGGAIEQSDLVGAARAEFAKLERPFTVPGGMA
jgi:ATPase family associated with various cellular activities (AAA)